LFLKVLFSVEIIGVAHGDEFSLLYKMDGLVSVMPGDKDYEMSKDLVKLWTSFATDEYVPLF
jgi:hypothetical protein